MGASLPSLFEDNLRLLRRMLVYNPKSTDDLLRIPVGGVVTGYIGLESGTMLLRQSGVERLGDLVLRSRQDLLDIDGLGERKVALIENALTVLGLALRPDARASVAVRAMALQ